MQLFIQTIRTLRAYIAMWDETNRLLALLEGFIPEDALDVEL